ncbi:hypothetical protein F8388_012160 [Cannabis sativa]|uniref:PWWP domain-containing protein n=2 Tax=Cannabis sativa TaxID=3483 RepID=A0A7J6E453_CANSA|nr:hypothetical protein F8388_012160 [Cannabis sativa]KAF4361504.1 hypothetical protein G4B88_016714 [Cannabis sativa]
MENPKTLESESPDDKTAKETSGFSESRELGEKNNGLASCSDISIAVDETKVFTNNDLGVENVEVATQLVKAENVGGVKGDEKEAGLGLIGSTFDKKNEAEMGLLKSQSDEGRNEDKPLVSTEIAVSSGGISLFVDFSGSAGNYMHKDVNVENSSSLEESKKDIKYENGEQGASIDNQDLNFSVGDIVWVQTKNQTWWPAKICNPVDAPKHAARTGEGDQFLVGYYGINHFAWCCPSQLKPFHENFEQMKRETKASRIFVGAVEKAVDEFGGHVKLEMICSCALSRNQLTAAKEGSFAKGVVKSKQKSTRLGEFSVSKFEPVMFLDCLKYLAKVVSLPRTSLDFAVTHNRLSAFNLYNGHTQLPMHLLTERASVVEDKVSVKDKKVFHGIRRCNNAEEGSCDLSEAKKKKMKKKSAVKVEDGKGKKEDLVVLCKSTPTKGTEGSIGDVSGKKRIIEKGFDSRERKKSRYLSYPYVSWEKKDSSTGTKDPPEENVGDDQNMVSPLNLKCSGEKFWKKWYRGFSGEGNIPGSSELISVAPAELLCEIRSAAVDCLHPNGSNKFNLIGWTFSRFRTSVYHDEVADEISPKNVIGRNELNAAEACLSANNVEEGKCLSKTKRTKKKEASKHSVCSPDVIGSAEINVEEDKRNSKPKRTKRKEASKHSTVCLPDAIGSAENNVEEDKCNSKPKRTKRKEASKHSTVCSPDKIGSAENNLEEDKSNSKPKRTAKKEAPKHSVCSLDVIGNAENSVQDVKENESLDLSSKENLKTTPVSGLLDVNTSVATDGVSVKDALEMGSYNKVKRRRKKKVEEVHLEHHQTNQTTGIPDLNGNIVSSVMVDGPQVMNSVVTSGVVDDPHVKNTVVSSGMVDDPQVTNTVVSSGMVDNPQVKNTVVSSVMVDYPQVKNTVVSSVMVNNPKVMSSVAKESNLELLMKMEKGALLGNSNANVTLNLMDMHRNNAQPGTLVVDLRVPVAAPIQQHFTSHNGPPRFGLLDKDGKIIDSLSEQGKSAPKKRKKREKAAPKIIPDLNGTNSESNSLGKDSQAVLINGVTVPSKPERKKRRKLQAAFEPPKNISLTGRPDTNVSYNKKESNGKTKGAAALLLTFAAGVPVPSREDLISTFCKYGPLKESETMLLKDPGSAQIVFTRSIDARGALQSIEKNNPFGSTLINYRLHDLSAAFKVAKPGQASTATTIATSSVMEGSQAQAPGSVPLDFIRQNLQMMTSMLEKSGNNLSPEMRTKLEGEIKGLLNKVSSISG